MVLAMHCRPRQTHTNTHAFATSVFEMAYCLLQLTGRIVWSDVFCRFSAPFHFTQSDILKVYSERAIKRVHIYPSLYALYVHMYPIIFIIVVIIVITERQVRHF